MDKKKQDRFLALYEPVHDDFERFCRARVYGDMDYKDLMNESLLKAYQKFDSLRSEKAFLSFLFSISVRILANNHRKKKRDVTTYDEQAFKIADKSQDAGKDAEVYLLYEALSKLPEEQKESIILFEISGFSIKEIAAIQHSSISSVKQRLRRGRIKLKKLLTVVSESIEQEETVNE